MSKKHYCTRVKTLRRSWELSQDEFAALLPIGNRNRVSRVERGLVPPNAGEILACIIIFGVRPRRMFPDFYEEIEESVIADALHLHRRLERKHSLAALRKRQLIERIFSRATKGVSQKRA